VANSEDLKSKIHFFYYFATTILLWQLQSCGLMNQIPEQDTLLTQNKIE
jgi:hypothetical protein